MILLRIGIHANHSRHSHLLVNFSASPYYSSHYVKRSENQEKLMGISSKTNRGWIFPFSSKHKGRKGMWKKEIRENNWENSLDWPWRQLSGTLPRICPITSANQLSQKKPRETLQSVSFWIDLPLLSDWNLVCPDLPSLAVIYLPSCHSKGCSDKSKWEADSGINEEMLLWKFLRQQRQWSCPGGGSRVVEVRM